MLQNTTDLLYHAILRIVLQTQYHYEVFPIENTTMISMKKHWTPDLCGTQRYVPIMYGSFVDVKIKI